MKLYHGSNISIARIDLNRSKPYKDFGKGYADNWGSDMAKDDNGNYRYNQFDLDDAIDSNGNSVKLDRIHFVKVQSAILKNVESIGEVSTEVLGFKAF